MGKRRPIAVSEGGFKTLLTINAIIKAMIKEKIIDQLEKILSEMAIPFAEISLETPADNSHGDYTTNIAFAAYRGLAIATDSHVPGGDKKGINWANINAKQGSWKNPLELAQEVAERFQKGKDTAVEKVEAMKPGFINFYLSTEYLLDKLKEIIEEPEKVGNSEKLKNKKYIVEYSSPNIAKPFTVGHLRTTIIGDAAANLLESQGAIIYRDNHIGDWGTQFGKQIYAIKNIPLKDYGDTGDIGEKNEEVIEKSDRPVKLLVDLYVRFHKEAEQNPEIEEKAREWFKKLEDRDPEAKRLWQKCIDWSWKEFDAIYKELSVHFTENNGRGYGESFFQDKMETIIEELKEKNLLTKSEGAEVVYFPDDKYPPFMIMKKDGATLYSTRDLATDKFRLEKYGKDITVINEIGAEQSLYMNQLYEVEYMLGWFKRGRRIHLKHGMYRFKDQKMSTRKGNVVWLEDVLEEGKKRAKKLSGHSVEIEGNADKTAFLASSINVKKSPSAKSHLLPPSAIEKNAIVIAIGAIKWNDLKRSVQMDIVFDWDEILTMEGNSGPYVQYTYARTCSILEKEKPDYKLEITKLQPEESELLRLLHQFPETIEKSAENLSPNTLATYLYNLAKLFNLFYQKYRILNADTKEEKTLRLLLTQAVGVVLARGLNLLGIAAPKKM